MFVVEFGSHVRDPEAPYDPEKGPRDIDALYNGGTGEWAEEIVRRSYPEWDGPVDLIKAKKPNVPVPYDCANRDFKILFSDSADLKVGVDSVRRNLASVFREGKGVEKALERLETDDFIVGLEEERERRTKEKRKARYHDNYSDAFCRKTVRKAAVLHFGEENLEILYERLWWGAFLRLYLSKESFDETGMLFVRSRSPAGPGRTEIRIDNKGRGFFCVHPFWEDCLDGDLYHYKGWNTEFVVKTLKKKEADSLFYFTLE